jgi:hypothetical protein
MPALTGIGFWLTVLESEVVASLLFAKEQFRMRGFIKLGGIGLLVLGTMLVPSSAQAAKKASINEQLTVLLQKYWTYFEEGKFKQAEQIAELAYELAPEDPQIAVALKLARRQQAQTASVAEVELQLAKVLEKLERVERQLREQEAKKRQRTRLEAAKEPPGSPDAY